MLSVIISPSAKSGTLWRLLWWSESWAKGIILIDSLPTCVNTHGINIFHVTDSNTVIIRISDNFIFYFFPTCHWPLHQNLVGHSERLEIDDTDTQELRKGTGLNKDIKESALTQILVSTKVLNPSPLSPTFQKA